MEFLYFLERVRVPVVNEFMLLITQFGEETAFLVAALILFWCVDKYKGYYILSVGFIGTVANQFLKLWFRIPRPWILDENFTILEQAREAASGYSFPVYYDVKSDAARTYGVSSIPTTYFIDANGSAVAYGRGALSAEVLMQGIGMITDAE